MGVNMGIRSMITKLFKKDNSKTAIINLDEVIKLPNRCDINDESLLSKIDKCKDEYTELLKIKGYILPNLLSSKQLRDEINMNIDLIVKQYFTDEELPNDKVTLITKYLKLKLYLVKLDKLGNEVLTRLIALKEIKDEKIIISNNKRHRISYEINSLLIIMNMFSSQRNALEKESNIYHDKILSYDNGLSLNKDDMTAVNEKLSDVIELVNFAHPEINTSEYNGLSGLVALERLLEIFAYQNKELIPEYKNIINQRNNNSFVVLSAEDTLEYNSEIKFFKNLELQYRIFYEYGRNIITDDDLLELYRLKFRFLTRKFNVNDYNIELLTERTTDMEYMCYKTLVEELIEKIVSDKDKKIKEMFGENTRTAISYMKKVLKNGTNMFDPDKILNDKLLFMSLLAFCNPFTMYQNFFTNFVINPEVEYPKLFPSYMKNLTYLHNELFVWNGLIPLDTLFKIDNINYLIGYHCIDNYSNLGKYSFMDKIIYLKKLYRLINYPKNDFIKEYQLYNNYSMDSIIVKTFYLPEGIKEIFYPSEKEVRFLKKLMSNAEGANVCFPKSLTKLYNGDIFENVPVNSITLNEGLEELNLSIFKNQKMKKITIPSTVKGINIVGPDFSLPGNIVELEFQNFKESQLLNNRIALEKLLNYCITLTKLGSAFFNITKIYLIDENNKSYSMDLKSIESEVNRIDYCTSQETLNIVIEKFKEQVYKQTGYMLGEYDNMPLDNIDEELPPEHLKVKKLTM